MSRWITAMAAVIVIIGSSSLGHADETSPSPQLSFEQPARPDVVPVVPSAVEETASRSAGPEETAAAIGHYHRARHMLLAAVREFDKGYKLASPEAVLNGQQWRQEVLDRAQDLIKVLDPQPRVSKWGVRYDASPSLLNQEDAQR